MSNYGKKVLTHPERKSKNEDKIYNKEQLPEREKKIVRPAFKKLLFTEKDIKMGFQSEVRMSKKLAKNSA